MDEGITATNTKRRDGFNRMIADTLEGKIDLIISKAIARFARNTVDSLSTIRLLKGHWWRFFEKENLYTFDSKGELLIGIISSIAKEESRSISENVKRGLLKQFSDGKFSLPYKQTTYVIRNGRSGKTTAHCGYELHYIYAYREMLLH